MLDLVSVSQSSPGPIAVNASLMIGYRMGGVLGAFVTAFGTTLPPLITISIISFFYRQFRDNIYVSAIMKGMQGGIAAVLCNVVLDMGITVKKNQGPLSILFMFAVFVAVYFGKVGILWIIIICAAIGILGGFLRKARANR
jgi:chromate transporter